MGEALFFVDSHCHFDFAAFDLDRTTVWQTANATGVRQLVIPGVHSSQWPIAAAMAQEYPGCFYAVGLHPWWITAATEAESLRVALRQILECAKNLSVTSCVAIGECGLDALIDIPLSIQKDILAVHLAIANEFQLPLILHCRKAHHELLPLLKRHKLPRGGVIHGFSGSVELAEEYWQLGYALGVGGTITYERAHKTRQAITQISMDAIVLETDAPDMPLKGQQGQRNSPVNIPAIAQALAELRGLTIAEVAAHTTRNAHKLFGFDHAAR